MKNTLAILLAVLGLSSLNCKKERLNDIDLVDFGHSNISWGPDCQSYRLDPQALYTPGYLPCGSGDTTALVYDVLLSSEKFERAEPLLHDLPAEIFSSGQEVFLSNCADCGGYYLRIKKGGIVKELSFSDVLNNDWPDYAKKTFSLLATTMQDLR